MWDRRAFCALALGMIAIVDRIALADAFVPITSGIQVKLKSVIPAGFDTGDRGQGIIDQGINLGGSDPRLFLVGRDGQIRVLQSGAISGTPFSNITSALGSGVLIADTSGGERGLLGAAFSPDFGNSSAPGFHKFYTYTSESKVGSADFFNAEQGATGGDHQSVIREWTANAAGTAIDTSIASRVVVRIGEPQNNHNGGELMFSPVDKYLYVSLGDGGGGNDFSGSIGSTSDGHTNSPGGGLPHGNAQDLNQVLGKILRINPIKPVLDGNGNPVAGNPANDANSNVSINKQYQVPKSNPFTADTNAVTPIPGFQSSWADEIYAYGLRNPFRFSFDRGNPTKLIAADVGQSAREEVDVIVKGGNYGWVIKEGTINNPDIGVTYTDPGNLIKPIAEYDNNSDGIAVIGGFVYRGSLIPALQGKYIFGEYFKSGAGGRLFYTDPTQPADAAARNQIFEFGIDPLGDAKPGSSYRLFGFGEDSNGEIYAMFSTLPSSGNASGLIMQFVPEPSTFVLAAIGVAGVAWPMRRGFLSTKAN